MSEDVAGIGGGSSETRNMTGDNYKSSIFPLEVCGMRTSLEPPSKIQKRPAIAAAESHDWRRLSYHIPHYPAVLTSTRSGSVV